MFIPLDCNDNDVLKQLIVSSSKKRETGIFTFNPKPRARPTPPDKEELYEPSLENGYPSWSFLKTKLSREPKEVFKKWKSSNTLDELNTSNQQEMNIASNLFCTMTTGLWLALDPLELMYKRHPEPPNSVKEAVQMWSFEFCHEMIKYYTVHARVSEPVLCYFNVTKNGSQSLTQAGSTVQLEWQLTINLRANLTFFSLSKHQNLAFHSGATLRKDGYTSQ
jgi:hypothetical protein